MILPIFQGSLFSNIFICCIGESTLFLRHINKNYRSALPTNFMVTLPSRKLVGLPSKRCHETMILHGVQHELDRYIRDPLTVTV